ncbi:hypothetical protein DPMN_086127 [Dreissena polymorpha]|uniref:Uncharacterized protein n=1 Tax=Dreissena polymorpha TaxID=45954 RepID=A0A9D3YI88_DREPO|nr:hypothetical protein DPMN_086127 [Dreissena polymorpha]
MILACRRRRLPGSCSLHVTYVASMISACKRWRRLALLSQLACDLCGTHDLGFQKVEKACLALPACL